jgi:hypothetical protein
MLTVGFSWASVFVAGMSRSATMKTTEMRGNRFSTAAPSHLPDRTSGKLGLLKQIFGWLTRKA